MKGLIYKYKNLEQSLFFVVPTFIYLFNIRKIVFPKNYQQDDVRELYISNYLDFSCVLDKGDNHPLWTYLIWLLSKITFIELGYLVSVINILLLIGATYFISKLINEQYGMKLSIFFTILFVSSPVILTYSVSLKQYMLELFYSCYCLYIAQSSDSLKNKLISKNFYIISFILMTGSLVNVTIFLLLMLYYFMLEKFELSNLKYLFIFIVPSLFFFNRIIDKLTRDSYGSYWENYFISNTQYDSAFNKAVFIFNMIFKSNFGFIYKDYLVYLLLGILILSFVLNSKVNIFPKLVILVFLVLNILKLYPLGTGRTDIVLIPFIFILFIDVTNYFHRKLRKLKLEIFLSLFLIILFLNINPFYKKEFVDNALFEIKNNLNETTTVIVSSEQNPSFEYYGQKVFGTKIIEQNNCLVKMPNIHYSSLSRKDIIDKSFNYSNQELFNYSEIYLLGIELDSEGLFRGIEEVLFVNDYFVTKTQTFPDGIYLSKYKKDS